MLLFRVSYWLHTKKTPIIPAIIQRIIRIIYSCELPYYSKIGKNVMFVHNGLGVVIHPDAEIGEETRIYQNVSIAGRNGRGVPKIGKRVFIGAGACILGSVTVEDDAVIGANAVVISDVPKGATAIGVPAKIISK
jgi:serine O-acetyltransferase